MSYRRDSEFSSGPGAIAAVDGVSGVRRRIASARARGTKLREQRVARVRQAMGAMPGSASTRPTYTATSNPTPPPPRKVTIRGVMAPMGQRYQAPGALAPSSGGMIGGGPGLVMPGSSGGNPVAPPPPPTTPVVGTGSSVTATPDPGSSGGGGGGGGSGGAGLVTGAPPQAMPVDATDAGPDLPDVPTSSSPSIGDLLSEHWLAIGVTAVALVALWRRRR